MEAHTHQELHRESLIGAQRQAMVESGGGTPAAVGQGHLRHALAFTAVMGLVTLALMMGFILNLFKFTPACTQEVDPSPSSVFLSTKLQMSDEDGRFDLFTVNQTAQYLVYGWVRLPAVGGEEMKLCVADDKGQNRTLQRQKPSEKQVFFTCRVSMIHGFRVSLYLRSSVTDSLFHLYRL